MLELNNSISGKCCCADITKNEKYCVAGYENGEIWLWNLKLGKRVKKLKIHESQVSCIKF